MRAYIFCLSLSFLLPTVSRAQAPTGVPVFEINKETSSVKFKVNASVEIAGTFDKWNASVIFHSTKYDDAVLDIKIQADSVNTGSGMKDGKLKGKDFFDVNDNPVITFHSTKTAQRPLNSMGISRFVV